MWDIDLAGFQVIAEPVLGLCLLGLIALLMRWTFSGGKSLVSRPPVPGREHDYGLLIPVHSPTNEHEAQSCRRRLAAAGIAATVTTTSDGIRLLVFPEDADRAEELLRGR